MNKNFVKLFNSKIFNGKDGSTWFFILLKKRMLIKKNREIILNENKLFKDFLI